MLNTRSMYPTLEAQSLCLVEPIETATPLERGHVVTVLVDGVLTVRRVVGLAGDQIQPDASRYLRRGAEPDRSRATAATMCRLGPSPRCTCELWTERIGTRDVQIQRLSRSIKNTDFRCDPPRETAHPPVPPGHVFVLADNRDGALDSRDYGAVPIQQIQGRVLRCR